MKYNFPFILRIISIISIGTSFISFIVITLCTNVKSPNFIEYTSVSKFFLNLYILILLLLSLIHSIYPKIVCQMMTSGLSITTTYRGKIILLCVVDVMYLSTDNLPQKLFGMITFVCALALLLGNLVFNCEILNQKAEDNNKTTTSNNNNNNNISINISNNADLNNDEIKEKV